MAVIHCESSGRADAFDGYNSGLMQVARQWHERRLRPDESLFDPVVNIRVGNEIFQDSGSSAWPFCGRYF